MTQHAARSYASKRDLWIVLLVWGLVLGLLAASMEIARSPLAPPAKYVLELLFAATVVLSLWTLYGTRYELTHDRLIARCGPFRNTVLLANIERVTRSRDPRSSPALSLDRLHIEYRGSNTGILVSPAQQDDFLRALRERCPESDIPQT